MHWSESSSQDRMLQVWMHTCWLVQMRKVGQIIAGFEHGRVHQRRQQRVAAALEAREAELDVFFLLTLSEGLPVRSSLQSIMVGKLRTSPFSSLKVKITLSPSTCFFVTSEATQPSVASGCHALVPTS